jgi:uncharacterized protein (TIGR03437 family)
VEFKRDGLPAVVPRSLVAIVGEELAAATEHAQSGILPFDLGGVSVTFGSAPAPVMFVSPKQVNVQVPSTLALGPLTMTLRTGESRISRDIYVVPGQAGLFSRDGSGCGQGAVMNLHADGSISENGLDNSFDPERHLGLRVFATGFGKRVVWPDGVPWEFDPAANNGQYYVLVGREDPEGKRLSRTGVEYSGPAPGHVGVDQIDVLSDRSLPEGCRVPVSISDSTHGSQSVTISIRRGGGPCSDPAADGYAVFRWVQRQEFSKGKSSEADLLQVRLAKAPGLRLLPRASGGGIVPLLERPFACVDTAAEPLHAGSLALTGPAGDSQTVPAEALSSSDIELKLGTGLLGTGAHEIRTTGGDDADAFATSIRIPEPIRLDADYSSHPIDRNSPLITWQPGPSLGEGMVHATLILTPDPLAPNIPSPTIVSTTQASAKDGRLHINWYRPGLGWSGSPIPRTDNAELIIQYRPLLQEEQITAISGISQGLLHTWVYEWRFSGVRIE